jgi:hypothetical protein
MISLLRRMFVAGSFAETEVLLEILVGDCPSATLCLAVRAPVRIPGLGVEIELVRDVVATIARAADSSTYAVSWQPADNGPFPRFAGKLSLTDVEGTHLALTGSYELPEDGILTRDAFLAHRIAQATAGDVLSRIATELERQHRTAAAMQPDTEGNLL